MFNFNTSSIDELTSEVQTSKELQIDTYHVLMNDDLTAEEKSAFHLVASYAAKRRLEFEQKMLTAQLELVIHPKLK